MELVQLIVIIVLILSLLIQAINFGASGYAKVAYEYDDSFYTYTNTASEVQKNIGYIVYGLVASAFSALIYIYLIVAKVAGLNLSQTLDWWCYVIVVHLQFGIAVVNAVDLKNNQVTYDYTATAMSSLTTEPYVSIWAYYSKTHGLLIASSVLTFIICYCGGLFLLARKTMELKNFFSTPVNAVNTELKDQQSLGSIK